jgi:type II secretory pathway pseudopilin PulG
MWLFRSEIQRRLVRSAYARGFSLVEVVVALGVLLVAGFGMIGLLTVGSKGNSDSKEQIQAASLAEMICSTLRAVPEKDLTSSNSQSPFANFPIPPLNSSASRTSGTLFLNWDGSTVEATDPSARFGLIYQIYNNLYPVPAGNTASPSPTPGVATLYLCLYWPAQASASSSEGHYELTSTFALP